MVKSRCKRSSTGNVVHKQALQLLPRHKLVAARHTFVTLVCLVVYLNGLAGGFVFDDTEAIEKNPDVISADSRLWHTWVNDFWGTPMSSRGSHKSYRPVTVLTYRLGYLIHGAEPRLFRWVNIWLHALACNLGMLLVDPMLGRQVDTLLFGLMFAVHPIHVEAVTGLVGRADVLSGCFCLTSVLIYQRTCIRKCIQWNWIGIVVLSAAFGMLSKETGLMALPIAAAYDILIHLGSRLTPRGLLQSTGDLSGCVKRVVVLAFSSLVLLGFRLQRGYQVEGFRMNDNPAAFAGSWLTRVLTFGHLWSFNLSLLLWPHPLCCDYSSGTVPMVHSLWDTRNTPVPAMLLFASACAFSNRPKAASARFAVAAYVTSFLPASNLIFTVGFVVAERVLYLPSMWVCLLVVGAVRTVHWNYSRIGIPIAGAICAALATLSLIHNTHWQSATALFTSGVAAYPTNPRLQFNLGRLLVDKHPGVAQQHFQQAVLFGPEGGDPKERAEALVGLGRTYHFSSHATARKHYEGALAVQPTSIAALLHLAGLTTSVGESTALYKRVVRVQPRNVEHRLALASMLPAERAIEHLESALMLQPQQPNTRKLLQKARVDLQSQRSQQTISPVSRSYPRAVVSGRETGSLKATAAVSAQSAQAYFDLAKGIRHTGKEHPKARAQALRNLRHALELLPSFVEAREELVRVLLQ